MNQTRRLAAILAAASLAHGQAMALSTLGQQR